MIGRAWLASVASGTPRSNFDRTCHLARIAFEEVVDRKDDRSYFAIHERDPTDVARSETFDALGIGHGLKLAGPGIDARHKQLHHGPAGRPLESSQR